MAIEPIDLQQIHVTKITCTARLDWKNKNGPESLTLTGKDYANACDLVENPLDGENKKLSFRGQEFLVTDKTRISRS